VSRKSFVYILVPFFFDLEASPTHSPFFFSRHGLLAVDFGLDFGLNFGLNFEIGE
jgi:hypothetical protein